MAPPRSAAVRAVVDPENSSSTSLLGARPKCFATAYHHRFVMSPWPPVITRLPLRSRTDLMFFAATKLWVPTARLLRKIFTLAPPPIALIESTIEELPIGARPAATRCNDRALQPELIKSKSTPTSMNKRFVSRTLPGHSDPQ